MRSSRVLGAQNLRAVVDGKETAAERENRLIMEHAEHFRGSQDSCWVAVDRQNGRQSVGRMGRLGLKVTFGLRISGIGLLFP